MSSLLAFAATASAQTTIPGGVLGTDTWDLVGSPYIVEGDITVASGATLTIEGGVEVRMASTDAAAAGFDTGRVEIVVEGDARGGRRCGRSGVVFSRHEREHDRLVRHRGRRLRDAHADRGAARAGHLRRPQRRHGGRRRARGVERRHGRDVPDRRHRERRSERVHGHELRPVGDRGARCRRAGQHHVRHEQHRDLRQHHRQPRAQLHRRDGAFGEQHGDLRESVVWLSLGDGDEQHRDAEQRLRRAQARFWHHHRLLQQCVGQQLRKLLGRRPGHRDPLREPPVRQPSRRPRPHLELPLPLRGRRGRGHRGRPLRGRGDAGPVRHAVGGHDAARGHARDRRGPDRPRRRHADDRAGRDALRCHHRPDGGAPRHEPGGAADRGHAVRRGNADRIRW